MVIPTEKTWHYIVGADAHIGPPRDVYGPGKKIFARSYKPSQSARRADSSPKGRAKIRRTDGADGGTGNPSPTMQKSNGYGIMTWFCASKIFGPVGPEKTVIYDRPSERSDHVKKSFCGTRYGIMTWFCVSKIFGPVGPEKMVICDRPSERPIK